MAESKSTLIPRLRFVRNVLVERSASQATMNNADISHGVLMGIATVLVFPIGGLIARLSKSRYTFWIHVGCQLFGLALLLAGFGTGIWTAIIHQEVGFLQLLPFERPLESSFRLTNAVMLGLHRSSYLFWHLHCGILYHPTGVRNIASLWLRQEPPSNLLDTCTRLVWPNHHDPGHSQCGHWNQLRCERCCCRGGRWSCSWHLWCDLYCHYSLALYEGGSESKPERGRIARGQLGYYTDAGKRKSQVKAAVNERRYGMLICHHM